MFVKICGVTTEEDALLSIGMGADALGFNFVPGSKRQIRPTVARDIVRRLPGGVLTVGVFRDEVKSRSLRWFTRLGSRLLNCMVRSQRKRALG